MGPCQGNGGFKVYLGINKRSRKKNSHLARKYLLTPAENLLPYSRNKQTLNEKINMRAIITFENGTKQELKDVEAMDTNNDRVLIINKDYSFHVFYFNDLNFAVQILP